MSSSCAAYMVYQDQSLSREIARIDATAILPDVTVFTNLIDEVVHGQSQGPSNGSSRTAIRLCFQSPHVGESLIDSLR